MSETWIEFHIHTEQGSDDSFLKLYELIEEATSLGIKGLCISEHFEFKNITEKDYENLYKSYFSLCDLSKDKDMIIYPGLEIKVDEDIEYLIYGLILPRSIFESTWENAVQQIKDMGGLIIQAHPFRKNDSIGDIDGIELYNSHSSKDINKKCSIWLKNNDNLCFTVGSDAHFKDEIGSAITVFYDEILTNNQLINAIKNNQYKGFIINGRYYDKQSFICKFK